MPVHRLSIRELGVWERLGKGVGTFLRIGGQNYECKVYFSQNLHVFFFFFFFFLISISVCSYCILLVYGPAIVKKKKKIDLFVN